MKFENGKLVYLEYEARRGERLLGKCSRRDLPEFLETLSAPCTIFKIVWRIDPKGEADPERKEKEVARKYPLTNERAPREGGAFRPR